MTGAVTAAGDDRPGRHDHPPGGPRSRWAWAEVDLDAIAHNVGVLREVAAPADLWAVVKADGYGHGAARVARVALDAGVSGLCVALVSEAEALRDDGIEAPILVLSQQPPTTIPTFVARRLVPTVHDADWVVQLAAEARRSRSAGHQVPPLDVHVKIDTGMHRTGCAPEEFVEVVDAIRHHGDLVRLAGVFTHLATADDADPATTEDQLDRFDAVLRDAFGDAPDLDSLLVHTANSAGTLAHPRARRALVRTGIAMYGISPGPGVDHLTEHLRPAMSLHARVVRVQAVPAGAGVSYGHRYVTPRPTVLATVPIGYADGVPRAWSSVGGEVLIGGRRHPIAGVVTMDQLVVDVGPDAEVRVGDEVVLIGRQRDDEIRAEEWARALDTIGYEIVCGIGTRVPRVERRSIVGA